MTNTNPQVKKGDKIILRKSSNYPSMKGNTFLVIQGTTNYTNGYLSCKDEKSGGTGYNFYYNRDEFCLATREEQIKWLKERQKKLEEEHEKIDAEIEFLEKYETEEDFVADKLDKILKAKGPKAIAKILKELKTSNYL